LDPGRAKGAPIEKRGPIMSIRKHSFAYGAVLSCTLLLGACGSSSPTAPSAPPTPAPAPPAPIVLAQGAGSLGAKVAFFRPLAIIKSGTLDLVVDWTFASNTVIVAVAKGECTLDQLQADKCTLLVATEDSAKPQRLHSTASAGDYTLIIGNIGPQDESISFQAILTPVAGASSVSPATGSTHRAPAGFRGMHGTAGF
jgi:hypothetical protein